MPQPFAQSQVGVNLRAIPGHYGDVTLHCTP